MYHITMISPSNSKTSSKLSKVEIDALGKESDEEQGTIETTQWVLDAGIVHLLLLFGQSG